jgi:hypothetical protein
MTTTTTTTTTAIDFNAYAHLDVPEKFYEDVKKEAAASVLKLTEAPKDSINMQDFLKKHLTVEDKNGAPLELALNCSSKFNSHNNAELETLSDYQQKEPKKPTFRNLYMGLNKSFFVIDFDGVKEHGDITFSEFWKLPNLPAFVHKLPYTKSRGCGLPHFLLRTDIDLQERLEKKWSFNDRYVNCFKDFVMDVILRCTWESTYSQIYNYHGEIPLIPWAEIQQSIDCDSEAGKSLLKAIHSKTKQPATFLKKSSDKVDVEEKEEQVIAVKAQQPFNPSTTDLSIFEGLTEIEMLLEISEDAYCCKGTHPTWHKVGQIIKNETMDNAEDGLRYFKNWTMKYGTENKQRECENHYNYNIVATPVSESKKKDKNRVSIRTLHYMVKELNPEKYEFVRSSCGEPYVKIDWGRLTDAMFAETMAQLYFQENVIFIGKEKKTKGYFYTGVYWEELGENNAVLCQGYFKRLYDYYQRRFAAIIYRF